LKIPFVYNPTLGKYSHGDEMHENNKVVKADKDIKLRFKMSQKFKLKGRQLKLYG